MNVKVSESHKMTYTRRFVRCITGNNCLMIGEKYSEG